MDYNTFYIYNEIISNNKYLYKKLWSINKNEDRNKFINAIYRQIYKAKIRDKFITNLGKRFKGYCWDKNCGYGTKQHLKAIKNLGITVHHRKTFSPINKIK